MGSWISIAAVLLSRGAGFAAAISSALNTQAGLRNNSLLVSSPQVQSLDNESFIAVIPSIIRQNETLAGRN